MPIAIFFIIFAGALAVALLYRHVRVLALMVAAFCAVLLAFILYDQLSAPEDQASRLAPQDIRLGEIVLEEGPRYLKISGRADNTSTLHQVREFSLRVRLLDCPNAEGETTDCATIGDETGVARVNIPPGQTRPFEAVLGFTTDFTPQGTLRWEHEVTGVRAIDPL